MDTDIKAALKAFDELSRLAYAPVWGPNDDRDAKIRGHWADGREAVWKLGAEIAQTYGLPDDGCMCPPAPTAFHCPHCDKVITRKVDGTIRKGGLGPDKEPG